MSLDVATIGIQLETQSVAEGERVVVGAFQRIGTSADQMGKQVDRSAEAAARIAKAQREQASIQQQVSAAIAEGKRRAQELQVTEENRAANEAKFEAQRQQRLASERALSAGINQRAAAERAATEAMVAEASAAKVLATAQDGVAGTTLKGVTGVRTLATAFSTLAASSVGLRGGLGSLVSTLGLMGPGAAVTIGVTAGIALIAAAYEKLTGEARKAKQETDDLIASLLKARSARLGLDLGQAKTDLLGARAAEQTRLAALQTGTQRSFGNALVTVYDDEAIAKSKAKLDAINKALEQAQFNINERAQAGRDKEAADAEKLARQRETLANRAAAEAKRRRDEEFRETKEGLERIADLVSGTGSRTNSLLVPTVSNNGSGLTASERILKGVAAKPLLEPQVVEVAGKQVEDRLSLAYKEAARNLQRGLTSAFEGLLTGAPDIGKQLGRAISSGVSGVLAASLTDTVKTAFKNLPPEVQQRLKGIAGVAGAGAIGATVGYSSGSTGLGALSGAAAGSAFGAPGIVVGAVAGIVGGLLGSAKQAREAAFRMEEARKAFGVSLKSFADEAYGTATTFSRAVASAQKAGEDLKKQAPAPSLGGVAKEDVEKFTKDLDAYVAALGKVDAATTAYIERLKIEEETRIQLIALTLDEREAKLAGNDEGALRARAAREEAEVARQLRNGEITQAIADRTSKVIQGELNQSIVALGDAAREASQALTESLVARGLQARLGLAGSDAERQAIEDEIRANERRIEREKAVADKVDAVTLALLDYTQGLEDQVIAQERANKASRDAAEAAYAQARATEDLTIRSLRATGQGGAADVGAQIFAQQEEKRKAIEEGRSAEYLKTLDRVQAEERAAADKARRDAQDQAFASAFGTDGTSTLADSRTSVNLAVGASEGQVAQMTGILTSQLFYQSALPRIDATLLRIEALERSRRDLSVDDVDLGLALAASDANAVAGLPPGNR